jgi:hypothetical protein
MEPVKIGAVMRAAAVGRVVKSKAKEFSEGDLVSPSLLDTVYRGESLTPSRYTELWAGRRTGKAPPTRLSTVMSRAVERTWTTSDSLARRE